MQVLYTDLHEDYHVHLKVMYDGLIEMLTEKGISAVLTCML